MDTDTSINSESFRAEIIVASAAAGATVALSLVFEFVLAVEPSFYLQASPLVVYFVYLFSHSRLPAGYDRSRNWVVLSLAVAGVALVVTML